MLVTGASGGIGFAIADAFLKDGHRVVLHAHRHSEIVETLERQAAGKGLQAYALTCDLSVPNEISQMLEKIEKRFGAVEVLINNAGIALPQQLLTDCSIEEWDSLFSVDVRSAFLLSKGVLPNMISNKSGSIVNISSIWGVTGGSCEVPYSAAKAAVIGFTKALAKEVGPSGIRVNCVAPGFIDTAMNAHLSKEDCDAFFMETPLCREGTVEDVAGAVKFLALNESNFITGQVITVDGGYTI